MFYQSWGIPHINAYCDAAATSAVVKRLGPCRFKHISIRGIWLHDEVNAGLLTLRKAIPPENPPQLMTKVVKSQALHDHLSTHSGLYLQLQGMSINVHDTIEPYMAAKFLHMVSLISVAYMTEWTIEEWFVQVAHTVFVQVAHGNRRHEY